MEERIAHHVSKLQRLSPRLLGCHVTLDAPHQHRSHGGHYLVRIEIGVPGRTLVVSHDPAEQKGREDLYSAIDDAFGDAARLVARDSDRNRKP